MKKSLLYTGTGDAGTTSLVGGRRVSKADARLEAYGTVDELNSWIGLVAASVDPSPETAEVLRRVQNKMFNIGAYLATAPADSGASPVAVAGLDENDIALLEREIDRLDELVPPLTRFVLPGGSKAASLCQVARTVCRRCERRIVTLAQSSPVDPIVIKYINRLSDFLFVFARFNNINNQVDEIFWDKDC